MHMHAIAGEIMLQKALIRKSIFVAQCRTGAGRTEIFA